MIPAHIWGARVAICSLLCQLKRFEYPTQGVIAVRNKRVTEFMLPSYIVLIDVASHGRTMSFVTLGSSSLQQGSCELSVDHLAPGHLQPLWKCTPVGAYQTCPKVRMDYGKGIWDWKYMINGNLRTWVIKWINKYEKTAQSTKYVWDTQSYIALTLLVKMNLKICMFTCDRAIKPRWFIQTVTLLIM